MRSQKHGIGRILGVHGDQQSVVERLQCGTALPKVFSQVGNGRAGRQGERKRSGPGGVPGAGE